MSTQPETNIAVSFLNIHSIITRGLKVSIESVQGLRQAWLNGEGSPEGFFNYVRALASIVHAHHLTEDELAFPYFQALLPDAPFASLMETHQVVVRLLAEIKQTLEKGEDRSQLETVLKHLESALTRFNDLWHPHIAIETREFINKADALIPVEEQLRLVRQFGEHGQKNALPPFLTVPFMLYNLSPENRKAFIQGMPAEVVEHLVPMVWKSQWESMIPYFLT